MSFLCPKHSRGFHRTSMCLLLSSSLQSHPNLPSFVHEGPASLFLIKPHSPLPQGLYTSCFFSLCCSSSWDLAPFPLSCHSSDTTFTRTFIMSTLLPSIPSFLFCSLPLVFVLNHIIMLMLLVFMYFSFLLFPEWKDFVFSLMYLLAGVRCLLHNRGSINMYELNKED